MSKRLFAAILFFALLAAQPALAAIASVGSLGTAASITSNTTLALTTTAQLDAGNLAVCVIALDNTATDDANTSEISGITDGASNTYSILRAFRNGQGTAAAGAQVEVWKTKAANTLASGGTITVTLANTRTSKAISCWEYTSGQDVQVAPSGAVDLAQDATTTPGSMSLAGLPSKEYLFLRAIAVERNTGTLDTPTSGYTEITFSEADTGSSTTSMTMKGEFIIATATGHTSNPTNTISGSDWAQTFIAIEEVSAGGGATIRRAPIIVH